jgi:hypothetical protein
MKCHALGLLALTILFGTAVSVQAQEPEAVPTSSGPAGKVDTPILRVPLLKTPPTIDGIMSPGEWDDASALSGFWYDHGFGDFRNMAPPQTQLQVYSGYDKEYLYFCWSSPIYPVDSWLRARGRYPDTLMHPLYGMLFDDHTELEIRPIEDLTEGFKIGLLRWDVNPIGTVTDWHWSTQVGEDMRYSPRAEIKTVADGRRWVIEYKIPLKSLRYAGYDAKDEGGRPLVTIPPTDGSAFRVWFARGIGGQGAFFNAFDAHGWNTTKMKLVFDSQSPIFQINEMGPLMDSVLNMQMTVKNHNSRSETVRLGFHIETDGALTYSTYQSKEIPDGLLQLKPGETKVLKLRQQMPGLSAGNVLWFDVRSAGQPAKTLFLTRLIKFHLMDSKVNIKVKGGGATFRENRVDIIAKLRPPRNPDFDLRVDVDPYTKRLSAVVDRGIAGVKEEVKTAVEAQLIVKKVFGGEQTDIHEFKAKLVGDFASFLCEVPNIEPGEVYEVTVLLFDENMKIVGTQTEAKPFINLTAAATQSKAISGEQVELHPWEKAKTDGERPSMSMMSESDDRDDRRESFQKAPWMENTLGVDDRVWEPFTPIQPNDKGFDTLKHRFTIDASGLPAQIDIRPDPRELPLEQRGAKANVSPQTLLAIGRGPQLRTPMRLEAVIGGTRVPAQVVTPAKAVRTWKSEIEYASKLRIGPVEAVLQTRYDCDGSLHATLIYGSDTPVKVDRLELVADIAGAVDLAVFDERPEHSLPKKTGVVWDSTAMHLELFYTKFVPWFWFGNDDRGWSYFAHNDKGWILDRDGSTMQLERDKAGDVTWRVVFVNHPAEVKGRHTIEFSLLTHPAKPKPENARLNAWQYNAGEEYQQRSVKFFRGYNPKTAGNYVDIDAGYAPSDKELEEAWYTSASTPTTNIPYAKCAEWRKDKPPFFRYMFKGDLDLPDQNRLLEDKALFYFERLVRIGRIVGWYTHPFTPAPASQNPAMDDAWLRPLATVRTNELPWHPGFLGQYQRNISKRLARVHAENNVPPRHQTRSGKAACLLESFMWNSLIWGDDGALMRAYEIDMLSSFPNSYYRFAAMNYSGLSTTMVPAINPVGSGDDPRLDRQMLGVALLHDFGVTRGGGVLLGAGISWVQMEHAEQAVRLLGRLGKFGFFKDADIEKLPFWRNDAQVRMGDKPGDESRVRVTVYRRPLDNGKGYKAIFVILNESDGDVELSLDLRDSKRILGGANTLRRGDVLGRAAVPAALQQAWKAADGKAADEPALMDLETGKLIAKSGDKVGDKAGERYGPVYVPYHDYRVLYGECEK